MKAFKVLLTTEAQADIRRLTPIVQTRILDKLANTLTVWLDDPQNEYICEETGDEVILMKDKTGKVIGFEKLNFVQTVAAPIPVAFEMAVT